MLLQSWRFADRRKDKREVVAKEGVLPSDGTAPPYIQEERLRLQFLAALRAMSGWFVAVGDWNVGF
jgi:hypothetical protein